MLVNKVIMPTFRKLAVLGSLFWILLLSGCATYNAQPLPQSSNLISQLPATIDHSMPMPPLRRHPFNPAEGLDDVGVAMLVVANNPDLKARRAQLGIAQSQLFAAHWLPDPQFSFSFDHPTSSGPGLSNAHSIGIGYDLMTLIDHNAQIDSAKEESKKTNLELLWQEWQTIQSARQLYFRIQADQNKEALLRQTEATQKQRYERAQHQLSLGNITLETLSNDLTGYTDIQSQLYQVRLDLSDSRHKLNALIGLKPNVAIKLQQPKQAIPEMPAAISTTVPALVSHRPDLLALRAGYQSQEAKVRKAILNQFPSINLGFNGASDTSNVRTIGLGLQLNLPLWNVNRGEIAIQRATREALRQTYQARIDQTLNDVDTLHARFELLKSQYQQLQTILPTLEGVYQQALSAYQARNFNSLSYLNVQNTLIKKQIEAIDLRLSLWDARISLETLLGWPIATEDATNRKHDGSQETMNP